MSKWKAGGVSFPHGPYMIGAGACKTPESTAKWLEIAPVVSGSYTKEPRLGNEGKVLWPETLEEFLEIGYGLNSYSMPNCGFDAAAKELATISSDQPLIVSVAGFNPQDYVDGVRLFAQHKNISAIELNFGCPNTQGEHAEIISFDFEVLCKILFEIAGIRTRLPIWVKVSPYSNPSNVAQLADVIDDFKELLNIAIVSCNTLPNSFGGTDKIDANKGRAGMSGKALKPRSLGQIIDLREHLDESIDVIGVGGITTGDDIMDFLDAGASAVQITSLAHWVGDPRSFYDHLLNPETASRFLERMAA